MKRHLGVHCGSSGPKKGQQICLIRISSVIPKMTKSETELKAKNNHRSIVSKTFPNPSEIITTNDLRTYLWVTDHRSRSKPGIYSQLTLCRGHTESKKVDNNTVNLEMVHSRDVSNSNHNLSI